MPVPENEETGVHSPQLKQQEQQQQLPQSNNFSGAIPIKKRRFPVIRSPSPSREEKSFSSEDNDSKEKKDSNSPDQGLSMSAAKDMDHPGKVDMSKTFDLIVKKEQVTDTHAEFGQDDVEISASKPQEANPGIIKLGPTDDLRKKQNNSSNEKSEESDGPGSGAVTHISSVKQEIVNEKIEGTCELELSSSPKNIGLLFGAKEPLIPALEHKINEGISYMSGKSDLSLLSLSLSREKLVSQDNHNSNIPDVSTRECANRSNWDLNTTMDAWEGSVNNDAFAYKTAGVGVFSNTNMLHNAKSSLSAASVVGVSLNKGKQVLDDHSSNSSNSSVQPSQQYKPVDGLGLSLAMPYRELDASGDHSSLLENVDSESVGPNLVWGRELSTVNSAFASVRNVKSEPVDENSKRDCSTDNTSNAVLSKLGSVKKEGVENHSSKALLLSSARPQKLVDHKSIKSELVQEGTKETSKSVDAILPQSVGRIMQHQESSASSSVSSISLPPQNSCPSRFTTCLELPMSRGLSSQSEHCVAHKELHDHRNVPDERFDAMVSKSVSQNDKQLRRKKENLNVHDAGKCELDPVNVHSHELCGNSEIAANDEEKINISAEMIEEDYFGSDCESDGNHAFAIRGDVEEKTCDKEDEEYEDGEVREPVKHSKVEDAIFEEKKTENVLLVDRDGRNVHSTCFLADQNTNASDFNGKATVTENNDETRCDQIKGCAMGLNEPKSEDKSLPKPLSEKVSEVGTDEKKSIIVTPEKPLDSSGRKNVNKDYEKEMSTVTKVSHGVEITLCGDDTDKVVKEIFPEKHDATLSKVEASVDGNDTVRDSNSVANKSRIINLPRASVVTTPGKTRPLSSRLLTSRAGKERYSDFDGEIHPRGNRDELYIDGPNKFVKDRVHDQSFRNSRPSFMRGKGRVSGRFGPLHNEWDTDHDYARETYNGSADYRITRQKRNESSATDVELECNSYGITPDGTSLGSGRRKTMNDEIHSLRRPPLRRLSPGDREGPVTRGVQMPRRFPRNISPTRCIVEDGSDFVGLRHGDKFMRHISDDVMDPVFSHSQTMYDELDGQLVRGNRNFSTVHRKAFPRIRSKSPVRSRTRSPGPWSSPRQRSPTGLPELTQHRSPVLYRMERMRSPDHACYRDEMVARRRTSPSFIARHANDLRDLRDMDSGREHVHPRPVNSNRRSPPPGWLFPRNSRRADVLDSRERADGDEYSNGPAHSNKFQALRSDGSMDERRKFSERRGLIRSFRPSYSGDNGNYHFHLNDGPRPYRFCQDTDTEFVERNNMREREFDGHIKHPPLNVSRRIRNEQQDGNRRPGGRAWHEDGFSDVSSVKRRRF